MLEQRLAVDVGKPVDTATLDGQMLRLMGRAGSRTSAIPWWKKMGNRD